jgi:hypothetical protein
LTTRVRNPKARAWDAVGLKFWQLGRRSAKPSAQTLRWFREGIEAGDRCLVVGGTSIGLIRAVARCGCSARVVDFSERICAEARGRIPPEVEVTCCDVTALPRSWAGSFDHLLCDTLINRFDADEARRFEHAAGEALVAGGTLRATVKVGLYAMDRRLLRLAGKLGVPPDFWDERTQTMDYGRLGPMLEPGAVRHGGISRRDLLRWYAGRGREKRFEPDELYELFAGPAWASCSIEPDAPSRDRVRILAMRAP